MVSEGRRLPPLPAQGSAASGDTMEPTPCLCPQGGPRHTDVQRGPCWLTTQKPIIDNDTEDQNVSLVGCNR